MGYQPSLGVTSDVQGGANCDAQDWLYSWEIPEFEIYLYLGERHQVVDKGGYGYLSVILNRMHLLRRGKRICGRGWVYSAGIAHHGVGTISSGGPITNGCGNWLASQSMH